MSHAHSTRPLHQLAPALAPLLPSPHVRSCHPPYDRSRVILCRYTRRLTLALQFIRQSVTSSDGNDYTCRLSSLLAQEHGGRNSFVVSLWCVARGSSVLAVAIAVGIVSCEREMEGEP